MTLEEMKAFAKSASEEMALAVLRTKYQELNMVDPEHRRKDDLLDAAKRVLEHRDPILRTKAQHLAKIDEIDHAMWGPMREQINAVAEEAFNPRDSKYPLQDPMVHRGIGDAVKYVQGVDSPEEYLLAINRKARFEAKEAKKKARSDRMKATWAAQRAQAIDLKLP